MENLAGSTFWNGITGMSAMLGAGGGWSSDPPPPHPANETKLRAADKLSL
jgi:hypothetical protein